MQDFFVTSLTPFFWLVAFVLLIIIEVNTYNLTTIWFAISCLPLIFLSWFGLSWEWQILIFVTLTTVLLIFTRPFFVKKLKEKVSDPNDITGKTVIVTKTIKASERGEVKTSNGVTWNAISDIGNEITKGENCTIVKVQGNTLIVKSNNV